MEVGDKVWARNLNTGKNELRRVSGLFQKHADHVMTITVAGGSKVTVTEEQPFYDEGLGWVMSGDLNVGGQLAQRDGALSRDGADLMMLPGQLLLVLIASVTGWLGSGTPLVFDGSTSPHVVHVYDSQHHGAVAPRIITERAPQNTSYGYTTHEAVDSWSPSASARSGDATTPRSTTTSTRHGL